MTKREIKLLEINFHSKNNYILIASSTTWYSRNCLVIDALNKIVVSLSRPARKTNKNKIQFEYWQGLLTLHYVIMYIFNEVRIETVFSLNAFYIPSKNIV